MKSRYFADGLGKLLIPFIKSKYCVSLVGDEHSLVAKLLSLSPGAVRWAITGEAEPFRNTEEHIRELEPANPKAGEFRAQLKQTLLQKLAQRFLLDHEDCKTSPLFELHIIALTRTEVGIKLATHDRFFFHVQSNWYTQMLRAKGPVKAGQLVGSNNPDPLLQIADMRLVIEEYGDAIASYDEVIRHWPNSEAAKHALHNKGVCLMRKELWESAISVFKSIPDFESGLKTILGNLAQCHARLKQQHEAEGYFQKAHQKFGDGDYINKLRADIDLMLATTATTTPTPATGP
jgi:tetratricopeptide (TPR) repeat protein